MKLGIAFAIIIALLAAATWNYPGLMLIYATIAAWIWAVYTIVTYFIDHHSR